MNLKLETEFSKAPILQEVDALKKQIDDTRPLSLDIEGRVMQKLRLEWNYNSNAIEGNKLSYGETNALLMHGITAKGKPLKDHLDIKGHNKAVQYLEIMVEDEREFIEADIRGLHEVILGESYDSPAQTADGTPTSKRIEVGRYKSTANHVRTVTGEIHQYATVEETPAKMTDLMSWYVATKEANIHPVVVAALFHHRFVAIHPFDDGNGRMARILMNLILMRNGYPPVVVKTVTKETYYALLSQADAGEDWPFIEYIAEQLKVSLGIYIKAINGGNINDDDDIDKGILLFKMQLQKEAIPAQSKSTVEDFIKTDLKPLFEKAYLKAKKFSDLFKSFEASVISVLMEDNQEKTSGSKFVDGKWIGLEKNFDKIKRLVAEYSLNDFDNADAFTVQTWLEVEFHKQHYIIRIPAAMTDGIQKKYGEFMSDEEQHKILTQLVEALKNGINYHLKN
jgi:Fic family protein